MDNFGEEVNDKDDYQTPESLKLNVLGNDTWWDYSFRYRRLIEITNPYSSNFTDYGVTLSFDYNELLQAGQIYQNDLDDIRIVENGILRKYYVVKDYPQVGYATIYFDTSISQLATETDTYMYFGNDTVNNAEATDPIDSFGWIKNGDFELDIDSSDKFEPFGWYFSHNPVNEILGEINPSPNEYNSSSTSYQLFVNKLINTPGGAERVPQGNYAYKWGTPETTCSGGNVNDYAGTFFTYPFTVPDVTGGISLSFYRNIRTYRFEEPKSPPGPGSIDIDGYFIRILNGSSTVYSTDPDLHNDDDISPSYTNYAEAYDGHAWYNPSSKKWTDNTMLKDFSNHSSIKDTQSNSFIDGDLTGYSEIDLTPYMGKEVFFEIGAWGNESNVERKEKDAFFQVDDLKFNYTISTSANEVQAHNSTVTIIARDVDGRLVPNAEISIINSSITKGMPGYEVTTGSTDSNGRITFSLIPNGKYNITANYTRGSKEIEVFNSYESGIGPYYYNGIFYTQEIDLDLWTIDFEIVDWDKIPVSLGYIEINESLGGNLIDTLTLDQYGKAKFIWQNAPSYYFRVFYDNNDYIDVPFLLNESYIYRNHYDKSGVKFQEQSVWVNNTNTNPIGTSSYSVNELIYSNGSRTKFGNKKIIKCNITLSNMVNQITNVSVYYIDHDNSTGVGNENLIYFEDGYGPGEDNDFIELDIPYLENTKLESDNFEVYGLLISVNGINFTQSNGIINVKTIETCNIYNRTYLARLNIRVIKKESGVEVPYPALIKVLDNQTGQPIVNLSSRLDRDGYAFTTGSNLPFWFLKDRTYNISINSLNVTNIEFNVTEISPLNQWYPTDSDGVNWYNYTLYGGSSITFNLIFKIEVNITNYITAFFNASGTAEVFWGENLTYSISFYLTEDNGQTWNPITDPSASCTLYVREVGSETNILSLEMGSGVGAGNYTQTFNSSLLSAGGNNRYYTVRIEGLYPGYPDPSPESFLINVKSIPTRVSAHDYSTLTELTDQSYTAYFNDLINITIRFSINESGTPLKNALLSYTWIGLDPINFFADTQNLGYYTFTIDTSDTQTTGLKIISIEASYENYTSQVNFLVYLTVLERQTTLNGLDELAYLSPKIWVQDTHYFTFTYADANTVDILGDLTIATYSWYELDESGNRVPGSQGTGMLTQYPNKSYYVDFNTELRVVGYYLLHVTLQKTNFEAKFAYINLEIQLREFDYSIVGLGTNNQIRLHQGEEVELEVSLTDLSRNVELENAQVSLNLGGINYDVDESLTTPGLYTTTINTASIDTFITSKTFVGTLTIEMDNFTKQEISITLVVLMEEIFPGMPTFYFILIIASVIGVIGSIVSYRVIQQARIPKHVKKIRKIKGIIKSNKKLSDTFSIPTKEEMTAKLFGDDWRELGLSIEDALGIQDLKSKKLPVKDKIITEKGENE
ncbi:MAG: carboxypeptidase-like regulatory domain-containing protein [Promethearchaeota archaeon]